KMRCGLSGSRSTVRATRCADDRCSAGDFRCARTVGFRRCHPPVAMALSGGQCRSHRLAHFFAGAVAVMDIRLLGGLAATSPACLLARARSFAVVALAGMAVTGCVLFSAEASHLALNPAFQLKATLVAAGLINVAIYEFWAKRAVERLAPGASMPARAKVAGVLSLGIWVAVAACGRSIAYF